MELVIASVELKEGNVLSFKTFPSPPCLLGFALTFHAVGDVSAELTYRVRKWQDVIYQGEPVPVHPRQAEDQKLSTHADSIEVVFPGQGNYLLDILSGDSLLYSLPLSVFDSTKRSDLEREIIYYLRDKRGERTVQEITRGVYNPTLLNKANFAEISGKVYFALLRMREVVNTNPVDRGSLADKMNSSRWKLR